jgi:hypothetical protein
MENVRQMVLVYLKRVHGSRECGRPLFFLFTCYGHDFAPSTMLVPKLSCSGMTLITRNPDSV